jgi:hypothetical protein
MNTVQTFKPRPSSGWFWLILLGVVAIVATNLGGLATGFDSSNLFITVIGLAGMVIFLIATALAMFFPQMRYELRSDHLALLYGPYQMYTIPYAEIHKVSWQDLAVSPVSAIRLPGLALFRVPYTGSGVLKMCATSAATRILVIQTSGGTYGITPLEEGPFVSALMQHVKG